MINLCVNDNDWKICPLLHLTSSIDAIFVIREKTKYRKLDHIFLKMQKTNDITLKKKYLSKNESLLKDNNILWKCTKIRVWKKTSIDNLFNEKNKEIKLIKENAFCTN